MSTEIKVLGSLQLLIILNKFYMKKLERWKREGMTEVGLESTPQSGFVSPPGSLAEQKLAAIIGRRISKLHNIQKMRVIHNAMHNLYGRHNPINYKPEFNFQENWESTSKDSYLEDKYNMLNTENHLFISLHLAICLIFGLLAWFFSVYRVFSFDDEFCSIVGILVVFQLLDGILKQFLMFSFMEEKNVSRSSLGLKDYLKLHWRGMAIMGYLGIMLSEELLVGRDKTPFLFLADICFVLISHQRFKELYEGIKIKILASRYRNEIMIMQLFGNCIMLVHVFGVVLYLVSLTDQEMNWRSNIQGFDVSWGSRYIYSVYFACTTALTVGYGDITPKNLFEIITILCVQVVGLINMGYIVNQIGRILSKMNQRQELFHKSISEAEMLTKDYQLPEDLAAKMKTYIINNQITSDQLNVEEEDNFLNRLNDEIREDVNYHHQLRIIKSSVFFLCHWSKKFQTRIATKLIRRIYSPQESLCQTHGSQKLYILGRGKLEIQTLLSGNELSKSLGQIEIKSGIEVHNNIYGYTALISGLIINIKAVVKDYSICYQVDKKDIMSTIIESENDFQYFHEIKGRIEQSRVKEIFQAPNINNTREHYNPNPYFIIKKDRKTSKVTNKRRSCRRRPRREKLTVLPPNINSDNDICSDSDREREGARPSIIYDLPDNAILSSKERQEKYRSAGDQGSSQIMITSRKYRRRNPKKIIPMDSSDIAKEEKSKLLLNFEESKLYKYYNPKFNQVRMLEKYSRKVNHTPELEVRSEGTTKILQNLGQELFQKLMTFKSLKNLP